MNEIVMNKQYRTLQVGETIKEGDEIELENGNWVKSHRQGQSLTNHETASYRRPMTQDEAASRMEQDTPVPTNKEIITSPGFYLTREGKTVEIMRDARPDDSYEWEGKEVGFHYTRSGRLFENMEDCQDIIAKCHNPKGVTLEQLEPEKGWRFLTWEEVKRMQELEFHSTEHPLGECQQYFRGSWSEGWGNSEVDTYRTKSPLTIPTETPKTKDMKNKPVFVFISNNPELSRFIQEQCFAVGLTTIGGGGIIDTNGSNPCIAVHFHATNKISWSCDGIIYRENGLQELSIPEFLEHLKTLKTVTVKLNSEYTAEIKDGKVKCGCQTFEFGPILELAEKVKEAQK